MKSDAIAYEEACSQRKCTSSDFEMDTPHRALIVFTPINTSNPRGSACNIIYFCGSSVHSKIYLPDTTDARFSTKSYHFNILFPFFGLSFCCNSPITSRVHQCNTFTKHLWAATNLSFTEGRDCRLSFVLLEEFHKK